MADKYELILWNFEAFCLCYYNNCIIIIVIVIIIHSNCYCRSHHRHRQWA